MIFALTFGDKGGWLLRGSLAVRRVTLSECEGFAGTLPEFGAVWYADDPAYRERFARQGVDWLTYCSVSNKLMFISLEPVTLLGVAVVRTRRCEWRQKSLCRRESAGGWKRGHRRVARRCAYASVRESF